MGLKHCCESKGFCSKISDTCDTIDRGKDCYYHYELYTGNVKNLLKAAESVTTENKIFWRSLKRYANV